MFGMKGKIRRLSAIALSLALVFTLAACGASPEPASAPAAPAQPAAPQAPMAAAPEQAPQAAKSTPMPAPAAPQAAAPAQAPMAAAPAPAPAAPPQWSAQSSGGHVAQSQTAAGVRGGQPGATTFADYERLPFTHTSEDRVSTFSLDTDRTSYYLALNWAREGYDVEPDSVRSEEWINAFNYGYAQPARSDSFAVYTDVIPHPLDDYKALARIGFQAPELRDDGRPLNVTLVLDASGSMADGGRVDIAREAAESIRKSLRSNDRIAVVHFTDSVIEGLTAYHEEPDSRWVRESIDRLEPDGFTNVQAGLDLGVRLADKARHERPNSHNYVILMSDGVANVDATNPFAILESAGDYNSRNPLRLITVGVGIANYNDYLLEQLAQHGNGWYRYLDDTEQARATFSRENWLALSIPFADQTRAQITWNPDVVSAWRIIGYENRITADENFAQARKEFAELPSGTATTVFYELDMVKFPAPGEHLNLGDVEVRWITPVSNESNRQHASITGQYIGESNTRALAMLNFGALVALTADRYSTLPYPDRSFNVHGDLAMLKDDLRAGQSAR